VHLHVGEDDRLGALVDGVLGGGAEQLDGGREALGALRDLVQRRDSGHLVERKGKREYS